MADSMPSDPSTCIAPDTATPTWRFWHLSVCAIGLIDSDHRQPGSIRNWATFSLPSPTTATAALGGVRSSSGELKFLLVTVPMTGSPLVLYQLTHLHCSPDGRWPHRNLRPR